MRVDVYRSAPLWIAISCAVLFALLLDVRFALHPIAPGLDPSWLEAVGFAQAHGSKFGDDISFTVGPLFNVLYSTFQGEFSTTVILFKLIYTLSLFAAVMLAFKPYWKFPILFFTASMIFMMNSDVLCLVYILACYRYFARADDVRIELITLLVVGLSVICLAKFSNILPTVVIVILADIGRYIRGKPPFITIVFGVMAMLLAAIIGVYPPEIVAFMRSGWLVSSGYSEAMNVFGSTKEVIGWLLLAIYLAIVSLIAGTRWKDEFPLISVINWLAITCILFMSFKHGFVRQDGHSLIAWITLAFVYMFVILDQKPHKSFSNNLTLVAFVSVVIFTEIQSSKLQGWSTEAAWERIASIGQEISALYQFTSDPSAWSEDLIAANRLSREQIARNAPFPNFTGTVDMMVNEQSSLVAAGAMLTPRPSIQEHGAYSPELVRRNGSFFLGQKAPDFFLFGLGTIDMRHPAFSEGPQWLTFLSRYEPTAFLRSMVILKKKKQPSSISLAEETNSLVSFGEKSLPPSARGAYFVKIKLKKTIVGRLMAFAFKMPLIHLQTNYADGSQTTFRLIPGMAEEGAILVPTVDTNGDFVELYTGEEGASNLRRPLSFQILTDRVGMLAYEQAASVSYSRINFGDLSLSEQAKGLVEQTYESKKVQRAIFEMNTENPPLLMRAPEGVFAHAPSLIRYKVSSGSSLRTEFGLRDGSWSSGGETDGVCFVVNSGDRTLAEQCLDPRQNVKDRGVQVMTVAIPTGLNEITLQTTCRATCAYDWSYWRKISQEAQP